MFKWEHIRFCFFQFSGKRKNKITILIRSLSKRLNEPHIHLENIWAAVQSAGTALEKCWRDDEVKTLDTGSPLITTPFLSALAFSTSFYFRLVNIYRYESRSNHSRSSLKLRDSNIKTKKPFIQVSLIEWNEKN